MTEFTISVNNIDATKEELMQRMPAALKAMGMQAENYAKKLCPVDTGRLRNSITHAQENDSTEIVGTNVEYAAYIELGTSRSHAQPYLKPALENHKGEYAKIAKAYLSGQA